MNENKPSSLDIIATSLTEAAKEIKEKQGYFDSYEFIVFLFQIAIIGSYSLKIRREEINEVVNIICSHEEMKDAN